MAGLDLERRVLLEAIDVTLKVKAGKSFKLRLEAEIEVGEDGSTIVRMSNVTTRALPFLAFEEGSKQTDPPPDHALGSNPEHPRDCRCPKCA